MAELLGVRPKQVYQRLEDFKAVVREHLINPCDNSPSKPESMQTTNGHHAIENQLDEVLAEVRGEPEPVAEVKPKRRSRRTKEEIAAANSVKAANTVKQPALVTLIIGGQEVTGAPGAIAAVMSAMPARAVP